jgi:hypothetical protein
MKKALIFVTVSIVLILSSSFAIGNNTLLPALKEGPNTTYVEPKKGEKILKQSPYSVERSVEQLVKDSTIIVKGKVVKFLGVSETNDLVDSAILEAGKDGYRFIHTDVLFRVDEYLGPSKLPHEELVIRHNGGRIGDSVHVYEAEPLMIGEEIILFLLAQPEQMTQIPEGYSKDQYFLFSPNSKYINIGGEFEPSFAEGNSVDLKSLKELIKQLKPVQN